MPNDKNRTSEIFSVICNDSEFDHNVATARRIFQCTRNINHKIEHKHKNNVTTLLA